MQNSFLIAGTAAYLLGSIPFGYILVRVFRGTDVRTSGSGNIGATNVARSSPLLGLATLLLDAGKGFLAVKLVGNLASAQPLYTTVAVAAFFVVLGHMFPIWLKFRGGKGVATGVGAFLALVPLAVLGAILVFVAVLLLFRYVSLASIAATAALPVFIYWLYGLCGSAMRPVLGASVAVAVLIIARHHQNIARLLKHNEPPFALRSRSHE